VGILSAALALTATALSVAREREFGTFDQMLVSPLMPHEILIGKTIPAILVGMGTTAVLLLIAIFVFSIPFQGSLLLLFLSLFVFITSIVGVGLFISSLAKTQQQAVLGTFLFMVPAISLSGYATPIANMPEWLQHAVALNPFKYFLITIKGVFLKNMPAIEVWTNTWPLLIIGAGTLILAGWFFKTRLE
jgi:ABC-2 type transport system permease protein